MKLKYKILNNSNSRTIWLDDEQSFDKEKFIKLVEKIPEILVTECKVVYRSMAPAQVISDIETNMGKITVSQGFEGLESGTDIYSDNAMLMSKVLNELYVSEEYIERAT